MNETVLHRLCRPLTAGILSLSLLLSGCSTPKLGFQSTDDLYSLPQASEEYQSLELELQSLLDSGLEYAPPLSGTNTQPVQLKDIDGDGHNEALAFFRDNTANHSPLKLYIFRKDDAGEYSIAATIQGDGMDINSILLTQLIGDSDSPYELVISWQVSSAVYTLSAYSLLNYQPLELMTPVNYTRYSVIDMDEDGNTELVLLNVSTADEEVNSAVYYDELENRLAPASNASLSESISALNKVRDGVLSDGTPVLYVTGTVVAKTGTSSTQITDILMLKDTSLCNITLNSKTLNSDSTCRYNLTNGQDIDGDGVLEIPIPFSIKAYDSKSNDSFYGINWRQFSGDGSNSIIASTYHNTTDGWYLELPVRWISSLELMRQDIVMGSTNERGLLFYQSRSSLPFLAIYKNTGSNRDKRTQESGRSLLFQDSDAVYTASYFDTAFEQQVPISELRERFHLIQPDWSSDY